MLLYNTKSFIKEFFKNVRKFSTIIILSFFLISQSFALTPSQKSTILENFKDQEYEMVFEGNDAAFTNDDINVFNASQKINLYNSIGEKIQTKKEYLQYQNQQIVNRVDSLQASIDQLDSDIADMVQEVNKINDSIIETKKLVDTNKNKIDILKSKIDTNQQILLEYARYLYKKGDYISDGSDIDTLKTILLSGDDIGDVMDDLYFKGMIQATGQSLIEKHRKFITSLYVEKTSLEKNENELKRLRKSLVLEKGILDDKRDSKARLLDITKGKQELYQKYIDEQLAIEKSIKVKELQERIKINESRKTLLEQYGCQYVDLSVSTEASRSLE